MLKFPKGYGLGYAQLIPKNGEGFKSPMLIVGCNIYAREKASPQMIKEWDLYFLFFPTTEPTWRVGILFFSKTDRNIVMLNVCESPNIEDALTQALKRPGTGGAVELTPKAVCWLTHSVYRCAKVALKDILALETYNVKKTA